MSKFVARGSGKIWNCNWNGEGSSVVGDRLAVADHGKLISDL